MYNIFVCLRCIILYTFRTIQYNQIEKKKKKKLEHSYSTKGVISNLPRNARYTYLKTIICQR